MSHLSQIKTIINNAKILKKTLNDLGFSYTKIKDAESNLLVKSDTYPEFQFIWSGQEYFLMSDSDVWKNNTYIESILEKIQQQYSYNSIIEESAKYGFTNINKEYMQDGSIKLQVQRWN